MNLNPDDLPSVILPKSLHQQITTALQKRLPCLGKKREYTKPEIWQAYQDVYTDLGFGDWLRHVEHYLR